MSFTQCFGFGIDCVWNLVLTESREIECSRILPQEAVNEKIAAMVGILPVKIIVPHSNLMVCRGKIMQEINFSFFKDGSKSVILHKVRIVRLKSISYLIPLPDHSL